MTSTFRFFAAACIAALALIAGLASGAPERGLTAERSERSGPALTSPSRTEIGADIERIAAAGLFPDARLDTASGAGAEPSDETSSTQALAAAIADPDLAAMVRADGLWTLIVPTANGAFTRISTGDVLDNGWRVLDISPSSVTLQGPDGERQIEAFARVGTNNQTTASVSPAGRPDASRPEDRRAENRREQRGQSGFGPRQNADDDEEDADERRERQRARAPGRQPDRVRRPGG